MDENSPLTKDEIIKYAPTYDHCLREIRTHLGLYSEDLRKSFLTDVPYSSLQDLINTSQNPEQDFIAAAHRLYPYALSLAQDAYPDSEVYCFIVDFWDNDFFPPSTLHDLILKGIDCFPRDAGLEGRLRDFSSITFSNLFKN